MDFSFDLVSELRWLEAAGKLIVSLKGGVVFAISPKVAGYLLELGHPSSHFDDRVLGVSVCRSI